MESVLEAQRALRWLLIVRWVAIADLLLLIILLFGSLSHNEKVVEYFGLVHGVVFMALIAIVGIGALRHIWGWWFLIVTFISLTRERGGGGSYPSAPLRRKRHSMTIRSPNNETH